MPSPATSSPSVPSSTNACDVPPPMAERLTMTTAPSWYPPPQPRGTTVRRVGSPARTMEGEEPPHADRPVVVAVAEFRGLGTPTPKSDPLLSVSAEPHTRRMIAFRVSGACAVLAVEGVAVGSLHVVVVP